MGAFELQDIETLGSEGSLDHRRIREERIIALKVYDSCRQQNCLTHAEIGPARAAEQLCVGEEHHREGDVIKPPPCAASATMDKLKIKRILILDKQPSPFKAGYWDVDVKFVFEYRLTFREIDASKICSIRAQNTHTMKVSLFGSVGSGLVIGTDLFKALGDSVTFDAEPFVLTEAKAVALHAQLHYSRRGEHDGHEPRAKDVRVTIGLFCIVKLFRLVNLLVESKGFDIPDECAPAPSPVNPCVVFDGMDFPVDLFAPPPKKSFSDNTPSMIQVQ